AALAPSWEVWANCFRRLVTMWGRLEWGGWAPEALLVPVQVLKTTDYSPRGRAGGGKKWRNGRIVPRMGLPVRSGSARRVRCRAHGTRSRAVPAPRTGRTPP